MLSRESRCFIEGAHQSSAVRPHFVFANCFYAVELLRVHELLHWRVCPFIHQTVVTREARPDVFGCRYSYGTLRPLLHLLVRLKPVRSPVLALHAALELECQE